MALPSMEAISKLDTSLKEAWKLIHILQDTVSLSQMKSEEYSQNLEQSISNIVDRVNRSKAKQQERKYNDLQ